MLHKKVAAADLAFALSGALNTTSRGAMVEGHVHLKLLGIGVRWRFPAGFLGHRVEIVRKVLGVRMANLPSCGKTCLDLYRDIDVSPRAVCWKGVFKKKLTIVKLGIESINLIKYEETLKL